MHALLIWFDRLPYGLLGCCGNTAAQTKGFDRFAAGSVTFDGCFADDLRDEAASPLVDALVELTNRQLSVRVLAMHPTKLTRQLGEQNSVALPVEQAADALELEQRVIDALRQPDRHTTGSGTLTVVALPGVTPDPSGIPPGELADIDRLLGCLADSPVDKGQLLLLTAERGDRSDAETPELHEQLVHVPLLGRLGPSLEFGTRSQSLVSNRAVPAALQEFLGAGCQPVAPGGARLLSELCGKPMASAADWLVLRGNDGTIGVRTAEWYLTLSWPVDVEATVLSARLAESAALYRKPEDLWECLDVASQTPDVVDALVTKLLQRIGESGV